MLWLWQRPPLQLLAWDLPCAKDWAVKRKKKKTKKERKINTGPQKIIVTTGRVLLIADLFLKLLLNSSCKKGHLGPDQVCHLNPGFLLVGSSRAAQGSELLLSS